jgi:hypothetical protein
MPEYRVIFPVPEGLPASAAKTAIIRTGETLYEVGTEFEHDGKRWVVTQAPINQPEYGATADLLVWPAA